MDINFFGVLAFGLVLGLFSRRLSRKTTLWCVSVLSFLYAAFLGFAVFVSGYDVAKLLLLDYPDRISANMAVLHVALITVVVGWIKNLKNENAMQG